MTSPLSSRMDNAALSFYLSSNSSAEQVDEMNDPKKPDGKTKIFSEHKAQPAPGAPDTDNIQTYIPGLATPKSVGKLVILDGPSAGSARLFFDGTNSIGRDPDQNRVGLDVEDSYISRTGHAILTVDAITANHEPAGRWQGQPRSRQRTTHRQRGQPASDGQGPDRPHARSLRVDMMADWSPGRDLHSCRPDGSTD